MLDFVDAEPGSGYGSVTEIAMIAWQISVSGIVIEMTAWQTSGNAMTAATERSGSADHPTTLELHSGIAATSLDADDALSLTMRHLQTEGHRRCQKRILDSSWDHW